MKGLCGHLKIGGALPAICHNNIASIDSLTAQIKDKAVTTDRLRDAFKAFVIKLSVHEHEGGDDDRLSTRRDPPFCVLSTDTTADLKAIRVRTQGFPGGQFVPRAEHGNVSALKVIGFVEAREFGRWLFSFKVGRRFTPFLEACADDLFDLAVVQVDAGAESHTFTLYHCLKDRQLMAGIGLCSERHGVDVMKHEVLVDDLREDDLPEISWSGTKTHVRHIAEQLRRVSSGDVEYLAVRDLRGRALAIGLIDHVRHRDASEIGQLSTHPSLQGRGLGTLLIEAAETRIKAYGHLWSILGVEVENVRARKLYERLGYVKYDEEIDSWVAEDESGDEYLHTARTVLLRKRVGG